MKLIITIIIVITIMLAGLFIVSALLLLGILQVNWLWGKRGHLVIVAAAFHSLWTGLIVYNNFGFRSAVIVLISSYLYLALARIGYDRLPRARLLSVSRRTVVWLLTLQAIVYLSLSAEINFASALLILSALQVCVAILALFITTKNLQKTRHISTQHYYSDNDLPSVTLAIPARNETAQMASCLEAAVSSNYPKLEILVLDDCSQDHTSAIIKDFAHDGVRFLKGKIPPARWFAKNYAYQQLVNAASGDYVMFCGVDERLGSGTIRALVTTMLNKKRKMMSVLPFRLGGGLQTSVIQTMRYWWELALPRRMFNRPPVLSSCWIIDKSHLEELGGFGAVSQSIDPEAYFAKRSITSDGYAFTRADSELNVRTVKSSHAQLLTALRTRYPQLKQRPENIFLLSLFELIFILGPFVLVGISLITGFDTVAQLALMACVALVVNHYQIISISNPANSLIALVNLPFCILTEITLLNLSMIKYEFSVIEWKGRNICEPIMRVIPGLPKQQN